MALGIPASDCLLCSAKNGIGIKKSFQATVVKNVPPPKAKELETKALIYDAHYDDFRGVINYIRVFSDKYKRSEDNTNVIKKTSRNNECGYFKPK